MKKLLLFTILFLNTLTSAQAIEDTEPIEEVLLDIDKTELTQDLPLEIKPKTLKEKLNDIYYLEIENTDTPNFLLKEILTKHYSKDSILNSLHLWGAYNAHSTLDFQENEKLMGDYTFNAINIGIDGKFKNNAGDFRLMLHHSPTSDRAFVQNLFADVYIASNQIPHHRFWIGNTRPPVGMEGGYSPYLLPFIARSQISRNFGTVRKLGTRITGAYDYIDYDLGVYSSDTYFQEFFPGTEFVGWVNFKPLSKFNEKYGKLKIGGGLQNGNRNNSYCVTGAYVGYEYKKWLLNFEWADADGYNGPVGYSSQNHARGFYTTLAYKFTPKVQGLIRYDEFDPNRNIKNNRSKEYSVGLNYFIKGQGLKLMLNYIFCQNEMLKDSHRILLGTQILL